MVSVTMRQCNAVTVLLMLIAGVTLVQGQRGGYQRQGIRSRVSGDGYVAPAPTAAPAQEFHGASFRYNPASAAVVELARSIGSIMGRQSKAAVFSPVSIASALSLMLLGADRETKNELVQVLGFQRFEKHLDNIHRLYSEMLNDLARTEFDRFPPRWRTANPCYDDDDPIDPEDDLDPFPLTKDIIRVTNAVFVQEGLPLHGNFLHYSKSYYNSTAANVPFASNPANAAAFINAWALRSTEGKIRDIVSETVAAEAQMIVASALYFKGLWSEPFEPQSTELTPFYPDGHGRASKPVLSMSTVGCFPYYDAREYDAKIVGLSYQGNKSALYIIMPNNSTRQVMQDFQRLLTPAMIGDLVSKMTQRKMFLQLPRMHITNTINLRDVLQQLGLRSIFNRGQSDLSGMIYRPRPETEQFSNRFGAQANDPMAVVFPTDDDSRLSSADVRRGAGTAGAVPQANNVNVAPEVAQDRPAGPQLHVSEFIHRVELDINEKGTEGGAITSSTIFRALPSIHFRVDTPFLLLLGHDDTRLPLFYGTIYDPSP